MGNSTIRGPTFKRRNAAGVVTDSGVFSFEQVRSSNAVKRKKPLNPVSAPTSLYVMTTSHERSSYITLANGAYGPYDQQTGTFSVPGADLANTRERARQKVLEKIKGEDWNLSTFLGELPETIQWMGKTLKSLVETYRAVRSGRLRDVKRLAKRAGRRARDQPYRELHRRTGEVSDKWLEWRYAVQPLMYDMDDMMKALYGARNRNLIRRVAGGATGRYLNVIRDPYTGQMQLSEWQDRAVVYYQVNPDVEAFRRLGLINPLAALWELTPLSFVVDWFIPIGNYVGNLDTMFGVSVLSSTSSRSVRKVHEAYWVEEGRSISPSKWELSEYSRSVGVDLSNNFPMPSLSLNASRFFDSLALTRKILLS